MSYVNLCLLLEDRKTLVRLADVNTYSNKISPITADNAKAQNAYTFILSEESTQPAGSIDIWDISYNYTESALSNAAMVASPQLNDRLRWIELVDVMGTEITQMREFINNSMKLQDNHDYLFRFQTNVSYSDCLYLRAQQIKNGQIKNDVYALSTVNIHNNSVKEITLPIPKQKIMIFCSLTVENESDTLPIYPTNKMIAELIEGDINNYFRTENNQTLGRSERKKIRETLDRLPDKTLTEKIQSIYHCDESKVKYYYDEFLETCHDYLDGTSFSDDVLRRLVDVSPDLWERLESTFRQEFIDRNMDLQNEIRHKEQLKNELNAQTAELQTKIAGQLATLSETETLITTKQKELDSFSEKFKEKLEKSKQDISSFLSEYTFLSSVIDTQSVRPTTPAIHISTARMISEDPETLIDDDELLEVVADNLKIIGVTKWSKQLARYLLGAYKARIPLIIAGPQCVDVLNAFSASFTNHSASIIEMTDNCDLSGLPRFDENGVVGLFNVIGTPLFGPFCRRIRSHKSYTCLLADTAEELAIEPRSIYSYALPLFTDFFIEQTVTSTPELTGAIYEISRALPEKDSKPSSLPSYIISQQAFMNCQCLYDYATQGLGSEKERREFGYFIQTLPLMLSLNYRDELLELIDSDADLDTKAKTVLTATCGAPNE